MSKHRAFVWDVGVNVPQKEIKERLSEEFPFIIHPYMLWSLDASLHGAFMHPSGGIDPQNPNIVLVDPYLSFFDPETGDISPVDRDSYGFASFGQSIWEATGKIPVTCFHEDVRDRFPHKKLLWAPKRHHDFPGLFNNQSCFYDRGEFFLADDLNLGEPEFLQVTTDVCLFKYDPHDEIVSGPFFLIGCETLGDALPRYFLEDDTRILLRRETNWRLEEELIKDFWFVFFASTGVYPFRRDTSLRLDSVALWLKWKHGGTLEKFSRIDFTDTRVSFEAVLRRKKGAHDKSGEKVFSAAESFVVEDFLQKVPCESLRLRMY